MPGPNRRDVAIVSAVTALSCNGPQNRGPQNSPATPSVVDVPATEPGASSTGDDDDSVVGLPEDGSYASRLERLRANATWKRLKALWREMDAVNPQTSRQYPGSQYAGTIDAKRGEAWSGQAEQLLAVLQKDQLLSTPELDFFHHAINLRIQNMLHGFQHLMMMHRLPPPYMTEQAASIGRLENKLDRVVSLRTEGKIGSNEFDLAMHQVQREAVTLYVIEQLKEGHGVSVDLGLDGESALGQLERKLDEAKKEGSTAASRTVEIVEEAKVVVPAIRELLAELER